MTDAETALLETIDTSRLPEHVAIIMDGNGRWAKKRGLPRIFGHRAGVKTVDRVVSLATELGIKALTLYSFSTENWNRPRREINVLMRILEKFLMKEMPRMTKNNIKFNAIGNVEDLPEKAVSCVERVRDATRENTGLVLTLALSYGSRKEIVDAVAKLGEMIEQGKLKASEITQKLFEEALYTSGLPEVDLLIRTSGEIRISNFLLWQIAYSELVFTDVMWPDFSRLDFLKAIKDFQNRERRFGLAGEQLTGGNIPDAHFDKKASASRRKR